MKTRDQIVLLNLDRELWWIEEGVGEKAGADCQYSVLTLAAGRLVINTGQRSVLVLSRFLHYLPRLSANLLVELLKNSGFNGKSPTHNVVK